MKNDAIQFGQEERKVSRAFTVLYGKVLYILELTPLVRKLCGQRVTVLDYADGSVAIRYKDVELAYSVFEKIRRVKAVDIAANKRLANVLKAVQEEQATRSAGDDRLAVTISSC